MLVFIEYINSIRLEKFMPKFIMISKISLNKVYLLSLFFNHKTYLLHYWKNIETLHAKQIVLEKV